MPKAKRKELLTTEKRNTSMKVRFKKMYLLNVDTKFKERTMLMAEVFWISDISDTLFVHQSRRCHSKSVSQARKNMLN